MHRIQARLPLLVIFLLLVVSSNSRAMSFVGKVAHQATVNGVRATVILLPFNELKKRDVSAEYRETHHLMVAFTDRQGRAVALGTASVTVAAPDGGRETKELLPMGDHAGENFALRKKGRYEVTIRFQGKKGGQGEFRFPYVVR